MQQVSHSGIAGETLSALIADLKRRIDLIDSDIAEAENQAGIFDVRQRTYPLLALILRARRDNIASTISVLEERARLLF